MEKPADARKMGGNKGKCARARAGDDSIRTIQILVTKDSILTLVTSRKKDIFMILFIQALNSWSRIV